MFKSAALVKSLQKGSITLLDWLFPPQCPGCGKEGVIICEDCINAIVPVRRPGCRYCGVSMPQAGICSRCATMKHAYSELACYGIYAGALRQAIHSLKYENNFWLAKPLASLMFPLLHKLEWPIDMIIPIPLGEKRKQERNYNQASLIAKPIAKELNISYKPEALVRQRETKSQVSNNREERFANVAGAFLADPKFVSGKKVLLIDDVFTTGATINAAATALVKAGAFDIKAVTLAKAWLRHT